MPVKEIENYYEFEMELEDGTVEITKIPRVSTRIKYKLSLAIHKLGPKAKEEDLAEILIDRLLPGLMDRVGSKTPTMISLGLLTAKIIEMDGDTIFGAGWEKKSKRSRPRGVKKTKAKTKKKKKKKKTSTK